VRVVHINTFDSQGGAARAAYRLHEGLRDLGHDSRMFVECRRSVDPNVVAFAPRTDLPGRIFRSLRREFLQRTFGGSVEGQPAGRDMFSDDRTEYGFDVVRQLPGAEVYHLHWVAGFMDYRAVLPAIPRRAPVVWTLHDMNPFTGGCHFDEGCARYRHRCGNCPQLGSGAETDVSTKIWLRKQAAYRKIPAGRLHLVAPSRWLAAEAKQSVLFSDVPVSVIPNGLNLQAFAPRDRSFARDVLGLPPTKLIVLCVADVLGARRKGMRLLVQALEALKDRADVLLVTVSRVPDVLDVPVPHTSLGHIRDERLMSLAYNAADVFVCPTLQDNLPNTILESSACGVPVVAFNVGGVPDIIRDGMTGILVPAGDTAVLGEAVRRLLTDSERRAAMRTNCRQVAVEEYALKIQAKRYVELYERMLASN